MEDLSQLQQLLNENGISTSTTTSGSHIVEQLILWVIVPSVIMLVIFVIMLVSSSIRRHRVERAIFEIRDILRDMQLQKQRAGIPASTPTAVQKQTPASKTDEADGLAVTS